MRTVSWKPFLLSFALLLLSVGIAQATCIPFCGVACRGTGSQCCVCCAPPGGPVTCSAFSSKAPSDGATLLSRAEVSETTLTPATKLVTREPDSEPPLQDLLVEASLEPEGLSRPVCVE